MRIIIKAKDMVLSDKDKIYADEKIGSLNKFFDNIIEAKVELGKEIGGQQSGEIFIANVTLQVPNKVLHVQEKEKKLLKAIDKAKDDLQTELKVYKSKLRHEANRTSIRNVELPVSDDKE